MSGEESIVAVWSVIEHAPVDIETCTYADAAESKPGYGSRKASGSQESD